MPIENNNKLRIVLLCHFSNSEIRNMIPLSKMKIKYYLKKIMGRDLSYQYYDFAPWVSNLISEFEKRPEIELHVISPMHGLKRFSYEFSRNSIMYHFFKPDIPLLNIQLSEYFDDMPRLAKSLLYVNRFIITRFIKKIKPDLINLIGTENPYYAIAALDVTRIPVYVSVQTVYTNPLRHKYSDSVLRLNWEIEEKLHRKLLYYGSNSKMHRNLILSNNPNAYIFKMIFPIEKPKKNIDVPKLYDFVFFAGIAKKKGIEDLLDAFAIVKGLHDKVTLNIVGRASGNYMDYLLKKTTKLELLENVTFTDYFENHSEMHQHVSKSRIAVLPIKLDDIPSSVIEAMYLELPVVTYKTMGTPRLNEHSEKVLISEIGDIDGLANNMLRVLSDEKMASRLSKNAKIFVDEEFENSKSVVKLIADYRAVIGHYYKNIPINSQLLFTE